MDKNISSGAAYFVLVLLAAVLLGSYASFYRSFENSVDRSVAANLLRTKLATASAAVLPPVQ
ncbi:MAG: hypothetical protein HY978_00980 [Candidatus Liptonbacteria bacterium]|nr:hypothetical protein [Candidatus Liptonbacteria bacterium]